MAPKRSRVEYEADLRRRDAPFVLYGTPLPPLDDNAHDDGSYLPVWKQEVTDEKGRKRLHGAFTGGFSAGYFNTVGSKEGWAPSSFVSSRSNRGKPAVKQQKVEDYMDEEDIREREEARQLVASDVQAGFGTQSDANVRHALEELLRPVNHSVGDQLLMRMGWREGQGIGSAKDIDLVEYTRKDDTRGLGLDDASTPRPLRAAGRDDVDDNEDDDGRPGLSFARLPRKTKAARKAGNIGLSIDVSSGEEDVYSMGPRLPRDRSIGARKKTIKKEMAVSANPALKDKPIFKTKSRLPTFPVSARKCHDGKSPLEGFVLADELEHFPKLTLTTDEYAPPDVPDDWAPAGLKQATTTDHTDTHQYPSQTQATIRSEQVPSSKSVFDFLSPAARDKLVIATGKTDLPPAGSESRSSHQSIRDDEDRPQLDSTTALAALNHLTTSSFVPYPDSAKQLRYEAFLRSASTGTTAAPAPDQSTHNHNLEVHEFARAAQVFRPSIASSFLSSRFTSATNQSSSSSAAATSTTRADTAQDMKNQTSTEHLLTHPRGKPVDPAEEAARMGMFGIATRSTHSWTPTRLLCKRLGVDVPVPSD